jgi:hypothetical protein
MSSTVGWHAALLDLLNTTPVIDGQIVDQLAEGGRADVATCARAGRGEALDVVRTVRDDLQRVVRMGRCPSCVAISPMRQVPDIGPDGVAWSLEADWPAHLVLYWGDLERDMPGRLRPCENDECQLFLIDHSRAGTARWCSMSGCGNRMKARRHYSRTRRD